MWLGIRQLTVYETGSAPVLVTAPSQPKQSGSIQEGPSRADRHAQDTQLLRGSSGTQLQLCLSACAPFTIQPRLSTVNL